MLVPLTSFDLASQYQIKKTIEKEWTKTTTQGHLRAFTKHAHVHKHKTWKHNPKVSPFGIALVKNGNKVRRCWYH